MWGATIDKVNDFVDWGFNPRTRVGCDINEPPVASTSAVSIHAPVWGATAPAPFRRSNARFNPRTRVGCDDFCSTLLYDFCSFNPRTRVGCDILDDPHKADEARFNPRTRVGCDQAKSVTFCKAKFQSTHPCGVRQTSLALLLGLSVFQSTHPCGVRRTID